MSRLEFFFKLYVKTIFFKYTAVSGMYKSLQYSRTSIHSNVTFCFHNLTIISQRITTGQKTHLSNVKRSNHFANEIKKKVYIMAMHSKLMFLLIYLYRRRTCQYCN